MASVSKFLRRLKRSGLWLLGSAVPPPGHRGDGIDWKMKKAAFALVSLLALAGAQADVIYSNVANNSGGNCVFSTTCASEVGAGNDYAAQRFTLASATTLTAASFTNYINFGSNAVSAANWMFLLAGASAPGAVVASGSGSAIAERQSVGSNFGLDLVEERFNLPSVTLSAGNYYFAIQAVSSEFSTYLAAANGVGAFETHDGGASWSQNFSGMSAVAVSLFGAQAQAGEVPEPSGLALTALALAGLAFVRRKSA